MTQEIIKSPYHILFVDDEENARKYFNKGLKHEFNVLTAGNVEEAIEILREKNNEIGVVITDQRMPGGNGVILLKFLKENYPHIIRLLTTAYSDLTDAIEAVNGGEILRYIQKPWDFKMLKAEMSQALELFELRLEKNKFVGEKIMVKKRLAKIERAKSLVLFAKYFSFLNCADIAITNFIKNCSTQNSEDDQNWQSFELGSNDLLEIKLFSDFIEKLQAEISLDHYNFDSHLSSSDLKNIFDNLNQNSASTLVIKDDFQFSANDKLISKLLQKLSDIAQATAQNNQITINLENNAIKLSLEAKRSNLLTMASNSPVNKFDVDLLACYLLVFHHQGVINLTQEDDQIKLIITLPNDPQNSNLANEESQNLDDVILSLMLD